MRSNNGRRQAQLARSDGASPAQVRPSKSPGSECCVRRRRRRTRSVHSGCVGCGSEPRNDELGGAETVAMVEPNMCNAVMRGIVVPPGSSLDISHYLCTTEWLCGSIYLVQLTRARSWRRETR